jgi:hypothetical protein
LTNLIGEDDMTTSDDHGGFGGAARSFLSRRLRRLLPAAALVAAAVAAAIIAGGMFGTKSRAASAPFTGLNVMNTKMGTFQNGVWLLDVNGNGVWDGCSVDRCLSFGAAGDKPVVGIWSPGDATVSVGYYRPSTNEWRLDLNHNGVEDNCDVDRCIAGFQAADPANVPVVGRWLAGDTAHKIGIYRNGNWFLDGDGDRVWNPATDITAALGGAPDDVPIVGRWNGSHDTTGVFHRGSATFYLDGNGNFSWDFSCSVEICKAFGAPGDLPVAGWFASSTSATAVGTYSAGTWRFDRNRNFALNGCTIDHCASGFGLAADTPVVGSWPRLLWSTSGDKDLSATVPYIWESSSAAVPPGANPACPNGAVILSGANDSIYRADLSCAGDPSCYSSFNLLTNNPPPPGTTWEFTGGGDSMTTWTPTNQLIHSHSTGMCTDSGCRVGTFIYQSTNCGTSWALKGIVDPSSSIALNGQCGLRQGAFDVAAVVRPSTGEIFIDKDDNKVLDAADLANAGTLNNPFVQQGNQAVVGQWDRGSALPHPRFSDGAQIGRFQDGQWTLDLDGNFDANCSIDACFTYGQAGDIAVVGRWNSSTPDLKHQVGVFRNGLWILDTNDNRTLDDADVRINFGGAGDQPVVGDWNNNGLWGRNMRVGVFRDWANEWFLDQGLPGWQGCGTDICVWGSFGAPTQKAFASVHFQDPVYRDVIGAFVDGNWSIDVDNDRTLNCAVDKCFTYGQSGDLAIPGQWLSSSAGWDRPVMYSDPFNGMLYVFPRCDSRGGGDKSQLYFSADVGTTWKAVPVPGGGWGSQMTSTNGGKLYLVGVEGAGDMRMWPATVSPAGPTVSMHASQIVSAGAYSALMGGHFGVFRIGRTGDKDVIGVVVPHVFEILSIPPDTQGLLVDRIEVVTTPTGITSMSKVGPSLEISAGTLPIMVDPTFVEGPSGSQISLLYWKEVSDRLNLTTTSVATRGMAVRASPSATGWTTSSVINLSRDAAGNARSWTNFNFTGHYVWAGAFGSPPKFLVHWHDTPGAMPMHINIVTVAEP